MNEDRTEDETGSAGSDGDSVFNLLNLHAAIHEAGHVLAAHCYGVVTQSVQIDSTGGGEHAVDQKQFKALNSESQATVYICGRSAEGKVNANMAKVQKGAAVDPHPINGLPYQNYVDSLSTQKSFQDAEWICNNRWEAVRSVALAILAAPGMTLSARALKPLLAGVARR